MKIAIAGSGAMGSRVGLYLTLAQEDVTFLDGWQPHIDKVNKEGLKVRTLNNVKTHHVKIEHFDTYNESVDLLVLLTKSMDAKSRVKQLITQGVITEETEVFSMMNGLGHDEMLLKYINKDKLIMAVTMWSAGMNGAGEVIHEGTGNIEFGRVDGKHDAFLDKLKEMFDRALLNGIVSEDITTSVWNKALVNCCFNTYCSITNKQIGAFGAYEHADDMLEPLVKEIIQVGELKGAKLSLSETMKKFHYMYSPDVVGLHYPSMHQDLQKGRLTEVDYLTGKVAEYGREFGIPTPYCDVITHLIHQLEK